MVLLVIDTQKLITTNALYQFETFVSHEKELIRKAREKGIEILQKQKYRNFLIYWNGEVALRFEVP